MYVAFSFLLGGGVKMYKNDEQERIKVKLSHYIEDWNPMLRNFFERIGNANTAFNDYVQIRKLFEWCIKERVIQCDKVSDISEDEIKKIRPVHIEQYLQSLIKEGVSKRSSISTKIEIFRSLWHYLHVNEYATKNVVDCIDKRRYKEENDTYYDRLRQSRTPSDCQLVNLLQRLDVCPAFECARNKAIIWTFCGTGIRLSELVGLDLQDIDFDEHTISFLKKGNLEKKSKTSISDAALKYINEYLPLRKEHSSTDPALFIGRNGKRINARAVQYMMQKYSNGELTPHMLRHWVGSKIFENTHNIKDAQEQLGHASYETTANIYVAQNPNRGNKVINMITIKE